MNKKLKLISVIAVSMLLLSGCSKEIEEYNKPAMYWYSKIIDSISDSNLDRADDYYSSLQGEHIGSPLLVEATLILAIAHMDDEEYILAEHFLNEYIKRYANANEKESAEFMKIKAKFLALPHPRRDQALIKEAIEEGIKFKQSYPNSPYYNLVDHMMTKLYMGEASLNESIADLYNRIDKYKSSDYYKNLKPQPWINWEEVEGAENPWYRAWFEGDGKGSWYGFLIPDTKSVVSRNSNVDENE
ncbi:outer membrane protein assembly factor BamD [Sulfurimonas sp.]|uniref:outer membrane protein assembly factor BamD n=1 Tax=Sulfurimonas sp. TaxID=2022749 RepID=UPI0035678D0A